MPRVWSKVFPVALLTTVAGLAMYISSAIAKEAGGVSTDHRTGGASVVSGHGTLELRSYRGGLIVDRLSGGAAALDLRAGDLIRTIDGRTVTTPEDLMSVLRSGAKQDYTVGLVRQGKALSIVGNTTTWQQYLTPAPPIPPRVDNGTPPTPPQPPTASY